VKDEESGDMVKVLCMDSLAAAHRAAKARMWARLKEEGGDDAVAELCEELGLDPAGITFPPEQPGSGEGSAESALGKSDSDGGGDDAKNAGGPTGAPDAREPSYAQAASIPADVVEGARARAGAERLGSGDDESRESLPGGPAQLRRGADKGGSWMWAWGRGVRWPWEAAAAGGEPSAAAGARAAELQRQAGRIDSTGPADADRARSEWLTHGGAT
jgi:hypothetical protein